MLVLDNYKLSAKFLQATINKERDKSMNSLHAIFPFKGFQNAATALAKCAAILFP